MASIHEIGIGADTRGFDDEFKRGIIRPVEDAVDAFKDLEKAASDTGADGSRSVDKLEDALKDAQRQTERLDDSMGDVGSGGVRNLDRVKDGARELQTEFGSNLGEAVSSFRGDLSDLGQTGQDTLGGLAASVAGMGPAGLAGAFALAAGAAGLGLFTAGQEEAKEKQEELNQAAAQWADAYTASAGQIVDAAFTVAEINAIATDPEKYQAAQDAAKEWGIDVQTAMRAMAGDATALATAEQSLKDRTEESNRLLSEQETQVDSNAGAVYDMADSVKAGRDRLDELNGVMSEGRERAINAAGALYDYATAAGTATGETDDLGNKIYQLPDGKQIVVDAETQRAYEDIDAIEKQKVSDKTLRVNADTSAAEAALSRLKGSISLGATLGVRIQTSGALPGGIHGARWE